MVYVGWVDIENRWDRGDAYTLCAFQAATTELTKASG